MNSQRARHTWRTILSCAAVGAIGASLISANAARATSDQTGAPAKETDNRDTTTAKDQVDKLPADWKRSSDVLWTVRGTPDGLGIYASGAASGYTWRTVAMISTPGVDTDLWTGNACLTSSGRRAVVAYAPRTAANNESQALRGARIAIVDMQSGAVTKLPVRGTLAYFSPGCGAREDAVVTQLKFAEENDGPSETRLIRIDAASAEVVSRPIILASQFTSAIPARGGILAVHGNDLMRINAGSAPRRIGKLPGPASHLTVDSNGRVAFLTGTKERNRVLRIDPAHPARQPEVLGSQQSGWLGLRRGTNGHLFTISERGGKFVNNSGVTHLIGDPRSEVSTEGEAIILPRMWAPRRAPAKGEQASTVRLDVTMTDSGENLVFELPQTIRPAKHFASGRRPGPDVTPRSAAGSGAVPTCSVPRNDPKSLVYQPTPRQVEWAVDQAVTGNLTTPRPSNWNQSGLQSWAPQNMFPLPALRGGGHIPPQVLLGVLAQESNLWQASNHVLPGEFGNPLVGDYYGNESIEADTGEQWVVDYDEADCGYGIGQITDGMRAGQLPVAQQRAIALDYATNIAKAAAMLAEKWNWLYDHGIIHSSGSSSDIENWFFATWAYNSGYYVKGESRTDGSNPNDWGVGWFNNPANPIYPIDRAMFHATEFDATHPADWPYPEKVIGWAAYPITKADGAGYRQAWWTSEEARDNAQPDPFAFCHAANACTPNVADPCPSLDSSCWWHEPVTYHDCESADICGHETMRFNNSYTEPQEGDPYEPKYAYPPNCDLDALPPGTLIVDDVPDTFVSPRRNCSRSWTSSGSFSLTRSTLSADIDLHQVGGGFGGHFWFAHTRKSTSPELAVTGTWRFGQSLNRWGRVLVHLPDHGAHTQQAAYIISLGDGRSKRRYLPQRRGKNAWVSLGVMRFAGTPKVTLTSTTFDGTGDDDIAFDAIALQPLEAKPEQFVVSMGDSYSSGEGASSLDGRDYLPETNYGGDLPDDAGRNACHRSVNSWSRQMKLPGDSVSVGVRGDDWASGELDYHMVACSGAVTTNLLSQHSSPGGTGAGQYGEVSQIDAGYLDENTSLVTISIGGNDAFFGPILKECASPIQPTPCYDLDSTGRGPNQEVFPAYIQNDVIPRVRHALVQVHAKAPNARIILMGYPELLSNEAQCNGALSINPDEAIWITDMVHAMGASLEDLSYSLVTAGTPVTYASPIETFKGFGVCGGHDPDYIHGVVTTMTESDNDFLWGFGVSSQSFHPNLQGATAYASVANASLKDVGL